MMAQFIVFENSLCGIPPSEKQTQNICITADEPEVI
jgi:hypothetical protein